MEQRDDPDGGKREQDRRTSAKNALKIFSECHRRESDRRGEADGGGNPPGHEADRRMINRGKKMIFATGARKRGAQFAIAERAAESGDSADDPQEKKRETRMNILQLKS